jgi:hypothetical protein
MKKCVLFLITLTLLTFTHCLLAQGTAFTYQGSLSSNGVPANGFFDFEFSLYPNAEETGTQVGSTRTQTNIGVTNGLFSTTLDFGDVFTGNDTWLAISVRSNGVGGYTALTPLQELTPAPYAIFATTASNLSGALALAQLPGAVVTNNDTNVAFVNLTLSSNLTLPLLANINSGSNSLLRSDGNDNFYAGPGAGSATNSGSANTGIGFGTLQSNINGINNTAIGFMALGDNTNGSHNTASGERALNDNTSGNDNTADGRHALESNTSGNDNTASGYDALLSNNSGNQNTAVAASALSGNPGGSNNIALGYKAGSTFGAGESSNIDIGNLGVAKDNNIIRIGSGQTETFIAGVINGNGVGLTDLSASQLTSGIIPLAQLPAAVVTNNETNLTLGNLTLGGSLNLPLPGAIYSDGVSIFYEDGNGNFFAGQQAGNLNTSGSYNTATGSSALFFNESGSYNTANGHSALNDNTSGSANTAVGNFALYDNRTGSQNVAIGSSALQNSTIDSNLVAIGFDALENDNATNTDITSSHTGENTAIGFQALQADIRGAGNTGVGYQALQENTNGIWNTAIGDNALQANMSGSENTAIGGSALGNSTTDNELVAIGYQALLNDNARNGGILHGGTFSSYGENTAIGYKALQEDTSGFGNTGIGNSALTDNTTGTYNTAIGDAALSGVGLSGSVTLTGSRNTAVGSSALYLLASGVNNVALGNVAGENLTSGDDNIYIANEGGAAEENDTIRIGTMGTQTATLIAGIYTNTTFAGATLPVVVDATGRLGTSGSSERFKQNIRSMDDASDSLLSLRPVTFQYKPEMDPQGTPQFGLVAEDVDRVNPDLVAHDAKGKAFTVRYDAVNAMLLNEFLKQHRKVEEQSMEIETLKEEADKVGSLEKQNDSLEARLNELEATVKALAEKK